VRGENLLPVAQAQYLKKRFAMSQNISYDTKRIIWGVTMLLSEQIKAARALLGWEQAALAEKSGVGLATIKRMESSPGPVEVNQATLAAIYRAFEFARIEFTHEDGVGVILRPENASFGIVPDPNAPGGVRRAYIR